MATVTHLDQARREHDAIPCLPMRKRSLDVDSCLEPYVNVDTSCSSFNSSSSTLEDSFGDKELRFLPHEKDGERSRQDRFKTNTLEEPPHHTNNVKQTSTRRHTRLSARGIRKVDYLASLFKENPDNSVADKNRSKAMSASTGSARRRSRASSDHRSISSHSDHGRRRCSLSDHLPTIEEFRRSDFEEDQALCGSGLHRKRSHSCGDVRRKGIRKGSIRSSTNLRSSHSNASNATLDVKGSNSHSADLAMIARKICEQKKRIENAMLDQSVFLFDNDDEMQNVSPKATTSAHGRTVSLELPPKPAKAATVGSPPKTRSNKGLSIPRLYPPPRSPSSKTRLRSHESNAVSNDETKPSSTRGVFDDSKKLNKSRSLPKMPTRKRSADPTSSEFANASWHH
jgi:hypothetical protein